MFSSASAEETTDESSLSLPRKKLKELKKIEKRRKNSVNVLIMDSVTRNFSLSKSTLGRLRPAIKCADTFILGMKYIVSPILLPVYIVYAFMNPSVKDAKVDVLGAHNIGSENNDTNDRKLRIQSEIPGGKLSRQYTIDCDEEKIIRTSNDAPVNSSSTKDQGMRFAVNTTKAAPEQSSFSSSSVQSSDMTQLGMRGPTNVYVSKNRKEKTSTRIQIDELAGEASSGMGRDNKFVGSTTQLIDGPALSDLSPYRYQGYFIFLYALIKRKTIDT